MSAGSGEGLPGRDAGHRALPLWLPTSEAHTLWHLLDRSPGEHSGQRQLRHDGFVSGGKQSHVDDVDGLESCAA